MAQIGLIIYGDINQQSGGYYYDRMLVEALTQRGHKLLILTAEQLKNNKSSSLCDIYIIDELCHPDFCTHPDFKWRTKNRAGKPAPVIAMVHHLAAEENIPQQKKELHLKQEQAFFTFSNYVVCNSQATFDAVKSLAGYTGPAGIAVPGRETSPHRPTPNTSTDNSLRGKQFPHDSSSIVQLLFLGNVIHRKGLHHVLNFLSGSQSLNCRLTVAGRTDVEPEYFSEIEKRVKENGLKEIVSFTGKINEEKKLQLLEASDFLVVPSSHEGYGIVYLEAMEFGTIPIASGSGGAKDFIIHGNNGFLVDPQNEKMPLEIYFAIESCLKNPQLYDNISRNARRTWNAHPTWEDTFTQVIDHIETLL